MEIMHFIAKKYYKLFIAKLALLTHICVAVDKTRKTSPLGKSVEICNQNATRLTPLANFENLRDSDIKPYGLGFQPHTAVKKFWNQIDISYRFRKILRGNDVKPEGIGSPTHTTVKKLNIKLTKCFGYMRAKRHFRFKAVPPASFKKIIGHGSTLVSIH